MTAGEMLDASKVAIGSIHLTLQNVITTLIGIVGIAFLARTITQEEMGILAAVTLITSLIQLASDFGLSSSLLKYVSELKGKGQDYSAHFISALTFRTPVAFVLCLLFLFVSGSFLTAFFRTDPRLIPLIAIYSIIYALEPPFHSLLLGLGQMKKVAICGITMTAARWIVILALVNAGHGLYGAMIGYVTGELTLLLLFVASTAKLVTFQEGLLSKSAKLIPQLLKFSWPLFLSAIVSFLYAWYDRMLLLAFLPLADVGVYDVSYKAFGVLAAMAASLGSPLFPYYGMAYGRKDHKAINQAIKTATRYTMLIVFPLTLGMLSTAKPIITLFAGDQYLQGWTILVILSVFGLVLGVSPAFTGLLLIYEKTKTVLFLSFIPVISSLALLPTLWVSGLNGLATIRGASMVFTFALSLYVLSKIVKVEIDKQALVNSLATSTVMAAIVLAIQQLYYSKFLLPAYALIGATIYFAGIRVLKTLNKADIELMRQIVGKKLARHLARILGYSETN